MVEYCVRDSTLLSKPLGLLHAVLVLGACHATLRQLVVLQSTGTAEHLVHVVASWDTISVVSTGVLHVAIVVSLRIAACALQSIRQESCCAVVAVLCSTGYWWAHLSHSASMKGVAMIAVLVAPVARARRSLVAVLCRVSY